MPWLIDQMWKHPGDENKLVWGLGCQLCIKAGLTTSSTFASMGFDGSGALAVCCGMPKARPMKRRRKYFMVKTFLTPPARMTLLSLCRKDFWSEICFLVGV